MNDLDVIKFGKASQQFFVLSPYNYGTFIVGNKKFRTLIHYWCAIYFRNNDFLYDLIRNRNTPEDAIRLSKKYGLTDFDKLDPKMLLYGVQMRVNQIDYVRDTLLCTGMATLVYDGVGYLAKENRYGRILMKVRDIYNEGF